MAVKWEHLRFPGRERLDSQVARACGSGRQFSELRHALGEWLDKGAEAPPLYVIEVETAVSRYFAQAAGVGRRWGIAAGVLCGLAGGLVAGGVGWLLVVLR